jgi:sugar transferase (PEP-CTERM system associated)
MASNYRLALDLTTRKVRIPVLRHYVSLSILLLLLLEATAFLLAYDLSAALLQGQGAGWSLLEAAPYVYALAMITSISTQGLYRIHYRHTQVGTLTRMLVSFAIGSMLVFLLSHLAPGSSLHDEGRVIVSAQLIAFLPVLAAHVLFFALVDQSNIKTSVVVLGAGRKANALSKLRRKSDLRTASIHGYIKCHSDEVRVSPQKLLDATPDSILRYALENDIEEILVAPDDRRVCFPVQELLECKMRGVNVIDLCTFFERETGQIKLDLLHPSWLIFSEGFDRAGARALATRTIDTAIALLALFFLFPVMLITALGILAESKGKGSVFYRQKRVGLDGAVFDIYKFRSMVPDAEKDGVAQWALADDCRITRVGRVIRKYRIDELPQLINVVKGEMSLVGPRPERPEIVNELEEAIPYYSDRHRVKPGITGWAQINYPYGSSEKDALEKLQYDLYYVKHNSLLLNVAIILQTAEVIFFKKGSR